MFKILTLEIDTKVGAWNIEKVHWYIHLLKYEPMNKLASSQTFTTKSGLFTPKVIDHNELGMFSGHKVLQKYLYSMHQICHVISCYPHLSFLSTPHNMKFIVPTIV